MEKFSWFVLPFALGFHFLLLWLTVRWYGLWKQMPPEDKIRVKQNLFSRKTLHTLKQIGFEVLIHRNIFRLNPLLGFMHMSFALGWFMLIVFGKIETLLYTSDPMNPVWYPLFFKFFEPGHLTFTGSQLLGHFMDFWLLLILAGQGIALGKRIRPKATGIAIRTHHSAFNKGALAALWFIFPLRLMAESTTAALYGGGGFLTGNIGLSLSNLPFLPHLFQPLWWGYSLALGAFFAVLPFSRYLHIPMEAILILLKNWEISDAKTLVDAETLSCSACGLCLDQCPLAQNGVAAVQPVYFINRLRNYIRTNNDLYQCLQCGQCTAICPVSVHSNQIRQFIKSQQATVEKTNLQPPVHYAPVVHQATDVVLFTGCMGKLTPQTTHALQKILAEARLHHVWIDREEEICCGKPLLLNGHNHKAEQIKAQLVQRIMSHHPRQIVTTCPICYNMLKNEFPTGKVLHHSQLMDQLVQSGAIQIQKSTQKTTFHTPCELARGTGLAFNPESILSATGQFIVPAEHGTKSRCCGGALAALALDDTQRTLIARQTVHALEATGAEMLVTACPLCKKTIGRQSQLPVKDLAQIVAESLMPKNSSQEKLNHQAQMAATV